MGVVMSTKDPIDGWVQIHFPNIGIKMSCENDAELEAVVEMLKMALKTYQVQKAKMALLKDVKPEKDERPEYEKILEAFQQYHLQEELRKQTMALPSTTRWVGSTSSIKY